MTNKIFWQDPYLTELQTTIQSVQGNEVTLTETIFYAFSGGQESDTGFINDYPVINARKETTEIFYTLPNSHLLKKGDPAVVCINWERRYKLMCLHFAAEIVLELVYKKLPHIKKIGAHIAEKKARIDFAHPESIAPILQILEQETQTIVKANQTITSAFSDIKSEKRYWKIKEFGEVPCGGTHIRTTSEIGAIKLKRVNPGKGKERIEIFLKENI